MNEIEKKNTSIAIVFLRILFPVLIIAGAISGYSYLKKTKPVIKKQAKREQVLAVDTVITKITDYQPTIKLYGEAVAGRKVEMRALVSGEIIETGKKLSIGSIIKKGEQLIKIDPFKYQGALTDATARLAEAKAKEKEIEVNIELENKALKYEKEQLLLAKKDLERTVPLAKKGTVTQKLEDDRRVVVSQRQQSFEQRRSNLEIQKSKLSQQQSIIKRLEWGVKDAKRNLKDTNLISPFNGYISSVDAEIGRIVSANDRVATLLDQNWIDIRFTLSDTQYGRLLSSDTPVIGRNIKVKWHVTEPPFTYEAIIERVSSEISSDTGGIEVFARIKDPLKRTPLRSGTFVEIAVPDKMYRKILRLPQTALFDDQHIYIVSNGRLKKREVELISSVNNEIIVRGNIQPDEEVLITRISKVGDGVKVLSRKSINKKNKTNNNSDKQSHLQNKASIAQKTTMTSTKPVKK